jgi:hypothetical protein
MSRRKSLAIYPSGSKYEGQWDKIVNPIKNKVASKTDIQISRRDYQFKKPRVCLRCMAATLGPWHYYATASSLRQHMRECIYPFNVISMKGRAVSQ